MRDRPRISFFEGARAVFDAFGMILGAPSLWGPALVPAVVLLVLESGFVALALFVLGPELSAHLPAPGGLFTRALGIVASVVVVSGVAVVGWFLALFVTPPLSSQALEKLVEHTERAVGAPPRAPIGFFAELTSGLRAMLVATLVGLPLLALLALVALLVPAASVVTVPLQVLLSSLMLAWGLFDYPLSLRGFGVRARLSLLREQFLGVLGFGLAFAILFWVPCCGVVLLPVGAVAATLVVCRVLPREQEGGAPGPGPGVAGERPGR